MSKSILCFLLGLLWFSSITFRSLITFSLVLYMMLQSILISLVYIYLSYFVSTTYWRDCMLSIACSYLLCHRLIDHEWVSLFLSFLSCSIDLYIWFYASTMQFWWLYLCSIALKSLFFLETVLATQDLWYFHANFKTICSSSVKKCHWYFHTDCIESIDCLG